MTQVPLTYEVIGSRVVWNKFGFEHGVNEWGVAIGNAGEFSKEPLEKETREDDKKAGLLDMDLVRLGLERGKTAYEAMHVIIDLLEPNGQAIYDNGFLIADSKDTWVLECADRYWIAQRIVEGVRAIGNIYPIETKWDECHPGLVEHAIEMGWCESRDEFNFAKCYSNFKLEWVKPYQTAYRFRRITQLLNKYKGKITVKTMMSILRDHYEGTIIEPHWSIGESFIVQICIHAHPWSIPTCTAASMVCEFRPDLPKLLKTQCWASYVSPCESLFRPFYLNGVKVPSNNFTALDKYSDDSPWWTFKKLSRHIQRNHPAIFPIVKSIWEQVEKREFRKSAAVEEEALKLIKNGETEKAISVLQTFVHECSDGTLALARNLDTLLYQIEEYIPKYNDLRREFLESLNKEAEIKFDRG